MAETSERNRDDESAAIPRSAFMAIVSHELRTPLNGIIGMTTLLQESMPQTPKQKEYLTVLMECSLQLMNLINNILDFTKMNSKKLKLNNSPFKFKDVIDSAVKITKSRADFKKLKFEFDIPKDLPEIMVGDSHRILQILVNLLSNAIKFTDKGYVRTVVRWSIKNTKYIITVSVEDTGIGIDAVHHQCIFDKFNSLEDTQLLCTNEMDASLYTSTNGTGLGLAICKQLCQLMNGSIHVESRGIKKGSKFVFSIELCENITQTTVEEKYGSIKTKKVLIVDDRIEFRIQLTKILLQIGITPTVVSSADEALLHFEMSTDKTRSSKPFDCALIDICMPYMSGTELAIEIRKSYPNVPLIGISSMGESTGCNLFNYFLHKPIEQETLIKLIVECIFSETKITFEENRMSRELSSSTDSSECYKISLNDMRVLVAEDEYSNIIVVQEILKSIGIKEKNIKCVNNGQKCINILKRSKRGYNLLLIDIIMPIKNGLDVFKWINDNIKERSKMTVVAMSAAIDNTNKQQCQKLGVNGFLSKPILKSKIEAIISSISSISSISISSISV